MTIHFRIFTLTCRQVYRSNLKVQNRSEQKESSIYDHSPVLFYLRTHLRSPNCNRGQIPKMNTHFHLLESQWTLKLEIFLRAYLVNIGRHEPLTDASTTNP